MTDEQRILVENELCDVLKAFHDTDDRREMETRSKEFFWKFCNEHNLDPKEVFDIVKTVLEAQPHINDYSDFTDTINLLKAEIRQKEQDER